MLFDKFFIFLLNLNSLNFCLFFDKIWLGNFRKNWIQISSVNNNPVYHLSLLANLSFQLNNLSLKKFPLRVNPNSFEIQAGLHFLISIILIRIDIEVNIFVDLVLLILQVLKVYPVDINRLVVILSQQIDIYRLFSSFDIKNNFLVYFDFIIEILIQIN